MMFGTRKKRVALKSNSTTRLFFAFYNLMLFTAVLFFFDGFSALGSCRKFTVYNINHNVITRIDVTLTLPRVFLPSFERNGLTVLRRTSGQSRVL